MVSEADRGQVNGERSAPPGELVCELAVVGCGDLSRADDGAGPAVIRRLREDGVPPGVRLVDGGTAGVNVAFQLRGAKRVVVVDATSTGAAAGTVFRVPGTEVEDMPPLSGLASYSFRWDHALAFARWRLGGEYPSDVTVYLIETMDLTPGGELSQPARAGIDQVLGLIRRESAFAGSRR
jgi:hydrogenase maturation protease